MILAPDTHTPQFVTIGARLKKFGDERGGLCPGRKVAEVGHEEQEIYKHGDTSV